MKPKASFIPCLTLLLLALPFALFGQKPAKPEAQDTQARDLYHATTDDGEVRHPGLQVKVYQETAQGYTQVSPHKRFRSGQRLKFGVESNANGWLYIVQRGTSGQYRLLYPHPAAGRHQKIQRDREQLIPGRDWFRFDNEVGTEEIHFIFARKKLDVMHQLFPPARTERIAVREGSLEGEIVQTLTDRQTRDLVFSAESADEEPEPVCETAWAVNTRRQEYTILTLYLRHR
jgi:hypothetical protein